MKGVILDPSCSGSGTVVSRMDHLLPAARGGAAAAGDPAPGSRLEGAAAERVEQLAQFQVREQEGPMIWGCGQGQVCQGASWRMPRRPTHSPAPPPPWPHTPQEAVLRHALTFPALQRLAYSTCSIHQRENEDVVAAVLPFAAERGFELAHALPGWPRRGLPVVAGHEKLVRTHQFEDGTDGFFVAVFERAAAAAGEAARSSGGGVAAGSGGSGGSGGRRGGRGGRAGKL